MASSAAEQHMYWCYDCDMSVSLVPSPSQPPLCPHCHSHTLHPMDTHPGPASPADNDVLIRLLTRLSSPAPAPRSSVDAMPSVEITAGMIDLDRDLACAVCRDGFGVGDLTKELPCKHFYHSECILPWLSARNSCPLCRFELPPRDGPEPKSIWSQESTPNFRDMMMEDQDLFRFVLRPSGIRVMEGTASPLSPTHVGEEAEVGMVEQANSVESLSSWLNWSVFELGARGDGNSFLS